MRPRPLPVFALLLLACSCTAVRLRQPPAAEAATAHIASTADAGAPEKTPLLATSRSVAGEALEWPGSPVPWIVSQIVTILPGQSTGWHRHGVPTYGHILSGTLDVEYAGLGRRRLVAGDSLMEAMRVAHNATNLGDEPVRILVVFMGAQGKEPVVNVDPPSMPAGLGGTRAADLVDATIIDARLRLDIRYAGSDNFTGQAIYPRAQAFLQRPAAEALRRANDRAHAAGFGLLLYDAYRPWSVTRKFWDQFPMHRLYLADPLEGSRHNRGCAVDLSMFDLSSGAEVPMPSGYDDFSERAHPSYAGGSAASRDARDQLRSFMEAEGFTVHENEWWHFDYRGWEAWPVLDLSFDEIAAQQKAPSR